MNTLVQYLDGGSAVKIASSLESAVRAGHVRSGERLPTVRTLAAHLGVSPATVAAAYRSLRSRGIVVAEGRRGTRVSHLPLHAPRRPTRRAAGLRDLSDGNPDPRLLPDVAAAVARLDPAPCLYGVPPGHAPLLRALRRGLEKAGVICGEVCVVSGAMDGIERLLVEHMRPGDRIAVEDPGFTGVHDLAMSRGLSLVPVAVDEEGPRPDTLERACADGAAAFVVTPRAQSPTGAALSEARARELRRVLRGWPDVLLVEDDHASFITSAPYRRLHDARRRRWAHLRSFSKGFNPDLRLAGMTGDDVTIARVLDRQIIGERWVSHLLQRLAHGLLTARGARAGFRRVARIYDARREALLGALRGHGLRPVGRSGYNVWLPVREETPVVQGLAGRGWAVAAGERFRIRSAPAIRITAATLEPEDAERFAEDLAGVLEGKT